jgi:hypothetical protein
VRCQGHSIVTICILNIGASTGCYNERRTREARCTQCVSETYVTTHSLYAAIYDESSPANVKRFMEREIEASKQEIRASRKDEILTLFTFNVRLMGHAKRGELLAWTLFLDGVFRCVLEIGAQLEGSQIPLVDNLGGGALVADLVCPTGHLIVGCLSRLGEPQPYAAIVPPGVYRVHFTSDSEEEFKHTMLKARSDYPAGDVPDWKFVLNPFHP